MATLVPCDKCGGTGRIPHEPRKIWDEPDPFDQQTEELCPPCGGSGKVPLKYDKVMEV